MTATISFVLWLAVLLVVISLKDTSKKFYKIIAVLAIINILLNYLEKFITM